MSLIAKLKVYYKIIKQQVNVSKIKSEDISRIIIKYRLDKNKQKIVDIKEDIEKIINHINSINYNDKWYLVDDGDSRKVGIGLDAQIT